VAKIAAWRTNLTINAVAIEDEATSIGLELKQEVISVDGFQNTGPERLVGNYDWSTKVDGNADFASGQGDATIFALLGSAGVAQDFSPTGAVAGASDPHYTGIVVLETYSIIAAVGAALKYTTQFQGASALTRAVA
jgi:hypothetical protein